MRSFTVVLHVNIISNVNDSVQIREFYSPILARKPGHNALQNSLILCSGVGHTLVSRQVDGDGRMYATSHDRQVKISATAGVLFGMRHVHCAHG